MPDLPGTVGHYFWDIFPELKDGFEKELLKAVNGEIIRFEEIEIPLIRFGKLESIIITFDYRPIKNQAGEVVKVVVWVIEYTQEVKQRKEIQMLNEELQASNEELVETQHQLNNTNLELQDNLTQLSRNEQFLNRFIMEAPAGLALMRGPDFIYRIHNASYQAILPGRNLIGRSFFDAVAELKGTTIEHVLNEVYYKGIPHSFTDTLVPLSDYEGGPTIDRYFTFNYLPWMDDKGNVDGILNLAVEVTEAVNARKAVEQLNANLEIANSEQAAANEELIASNDQLNKMRYEAVQAEHTLRAAIEAANFGTWHIDAKTRKLIANERLKQLFGFENNEEPTLEDFFARITDDYRQQVEDATEVAILSMGNFDLTYTIKKGQDNTLRWIRAVGNMQADIDGGLTAFTGVVLDITEQKTDEQRKNDFIGMVSHELKTPLTSMKGYVQILKGKADKSEDTFAINLLDKANKQVQKMTAMINGFLNVSRLESGKIQIDRSLFDMAELIKDAEEEVMVTVSSHNVVFAPAEKTMVIADRDKIGQVISNLIGNAVKYSPARSTINVTCLTLNDNAIVSVQDEGIGVAEKDISKLFDRYYRTENVASSLVSGFGIGLYLSSEIIHRHNGKIGIESKPGKGSTFWFSLPISEK